jgi:hypothetical protein
VFNLGTLYNFSKGDTLGAAWAAGGRLFGSLKCPNSSHPEGDA